MFNRQLKRKLREVDFELHTQTVRADLLEGENARLRALLEDTPHSLYGVPAREIEQLSQWIKEAGEYDEPPTVQELREEWRKGADTRKWRKEADALKVHRDSLAADLAKLDKELISSEKDRKNLLQKCTRLEREVEAARETTGKAALEFQINGLTEHVTNAEQARDEAWERNGKLIAERDGLLHKCARLEWELAEAEEQAAAQPADPIDELVDRLIAQRLEARLCLQGVPANAPPPEPPEPVSSHGTCTNCKRQGVDLVKTVRGRECVNCYFGG